MCRRPVVEKCGFVKVAGYARLGGQGLERLAYCAEVSYLLSLWSLHYGFSLPEWRSFHGEGFPVGETRRKSGQDSRTVRRDRSGRPVRRSRRRTGIGPARDARDRLRCGGLCDTAGSSATGGPPALPSPGRGHRKRISPSSHDLHDRSLDGLKGNPALLSRGLKGYSDEW